MKDVIAFCLYPLTLSLSSTISLCLSFIVRSPSDNTQYIYYNIHFTLNQISKEANLVGSAENGERKKRKKKNKHKLKIQKMF